MEKDYKGKRPEGRAHTMRGAPLTPLSMPLTGATSPSTVLPPASLPSSAAAALAAAVFCWADLRCARAHAQPAQRARQRLAVACC